MAAKKTARRKMSAKAETETVAQPESLDLEPLLAALDEPHELVILWEPGEDQPMRLYLVQVNGKNLAVDQLDVSSPAKFPLSVSTGDKLKVRYTLSPMVPISGAIIAVMNRETKRYEVVAKTGALERNQLWRDEVKVYAP